MHAGGLYIPSENLPIVSAKNCGSCVDPIALHTFTADTVAGANKLGRYSIMFILSWFMGIFDGTSMTIMYAEKY
jgi:hypothetical protein